MQVKLQHTVGLLSLVAVSAPTKMCETKNKVVCYGNLDSILELHPLGGWGGDPLELQSSMELIIGLLLQ